MSAEDQMALQNEIDILKQVDHPNIVKFYDIYEDEKYMYIVMELLEGGDLFDRIISKARYSEKNAAKTVKTVAIALKYIHSQGVVHRDLKPENLLYKAAGDDAELGQAQQARAWFVKNYPLLGAVLAVGAALMLRGSGGGVSGSQAAQGALRTKPANPDKA